MKIFIVAISLMAALNSAHAIDKNLNVQDPNITADSRKPSVEKLPNEGTVLGKGTFCPTCKVQKSAGDINCGQDDCRRIKDKKAKKDKKDNSQKVQ